MALTLRIWGLGKLRCRACLWHKNKFALCTLGSLHIK